MSSQLICYTHIIITIAITYNQKYRVRQVRYVNQSIWRRNGEKEWARYWGGGSELVKEKD